MNIKYTGQKTQTFKSLPIGAKFAWMIKLCGTPHMSTGWTKVGEEDHIADGWDSPVKASGYELEHQVVNFG